MENSLLPSQKVVSWRSLAFLVQWVRLEMGRFSGAGASSGLSYAEADSPAYTYVRVGRYRLGAEKYEVSSQSTAFSVVPVIVR